MIRCLAEKPSCIIRSDHLRTIRYREPTQSFFSEFIHPIFFNAFAHQPESLRSTFWNIRFVIEHPVKRPTDIDLMFLAKDTVLKEVNSEFPCQSED